MIASEKELAKGSLVRSVVVFVAGWRWVKENVCVGGSRCSHVMVRVSNESGSLLLEQSTEPPLFQFALEETKKLVSSLEFSHISF